MLIATEYLVLIAAFYWLMRETKWLMVELIIDQARKPDLSDVLLMGLSMVFLAIGFIRNRQFVPQNLRNYPVTLISPSGKEYFFPMAQAERISRKQPGWDWELRIANI